MRGFEPRPSVWSTESSPRRTPANLQMEVDEGIEPVLSGFADQRMNHSAIRLLEPAPQLKVSLSGIGTP